MMNGPSISCPSWEGETPPGQADQFRDAVDRCHRDLDNCAKSRIANDESLRRWHRILFQRFVPLAYYAGNFRQDNSQLPCLGIDVHVAGILGEAFPIVPARMYALADQLNVSVRLLETRWPTLDVLSRTRQVALIIATAVGEFIRIHPFIDGNGRISRAFWLWGLLRFGATPQCRIAPRPGPPYGTIMAACMRGDDGPLAHCVLRHLAMNPPASRLP